MSLDTLVAEFRGGSTPEQIAEDHQILKLADIYGAISYYLRHQDEVDAYLTQRGEEFEAIRREQEAKHDLVGLRERLLARRANSTST